MKYVIDSLAKWMAVIKIENQSGDIVYGKAVIFNEGDVKELPDMDMRMLDTNKYITVPRSKVIRYSDSFYGFFDIRDIITIGSDNENSCTRFWW